jgi:hypothetical protein
VLDEQPLFLGRVEAAGSADCGEVTDVDAVQVADGVG